MKKQEWDDIIKKCVNDYATLKNGKNALMPPRDFVRAWMQTNYSIFKLSGYFYRKFNAFLENPLKNPENDLSESVLLESVEDQLDGQTENKIIKNIEDEILKKYDVKEVSKKIVLCFENWQTIFNDLNVYQLGNEILIAPVFVNKIKFWDKNIFQYDSIVDVDSKLVYHESWKFYYVLSGINVFFKEIKNKNLLKITKIEISSYKYPKEYIIKSQDSSLKKYMQSYMISEKPNKFFALQFFKKKYPRAYNYAIDFLYKEYFQKLDLRESLNKNSKVLLLESVEDQIEQQTSDKMLDDIEIAKIKLLKLKEMCFNEASLICDENIYKFYFGIQTIYKMGLVKTLNLWSTQEFRLVRLHYNSEDEKIYLEWRAPGGIFHSFADGENSKNVSHTQAVFAEAKENGLPTTLDELLEDETFSDRADEIIDSAIAGFLETFSGYYAVFKKEMNESKKSFHTRRKNVWDKKK